MADPRTLHARQCGESRLGQRQLRLVMLYFTAVDAVCVNTIRTLAMDAVQKANSGHPGTPMALAPIATTLWTRFLRYDPTTPDWPSTNSSSCVR